MDLLFIHTIAPLIELFDQLGRQMLPGRHWVHILDEPLLEAVRRRGSLAPEDATRLLEHIRAGENLGVRMIMVTCSTVSPAVDRVRGDAAARVLKIDDPMLRKAVGMGPRIGVCATNPTTLEPTRLSILKEANRQGQVLDVEMHLVECAWEALAAGQTETHDRLVAEAVVRIAPQVDAVVLAQASMARCMPVILTAGCFVPVLSSPELAVQEIATILGA